MQNLITYFFKYYHYQIIHNDVNADYSSNCDTIVDLYMQAYELIRSV